MTPTLTILGVIGTAGRDKSKPMTLELWQAMCEDFKARLTGNEHLVSGGAAWADHLAVHAFLEGWAPALTLYLPAPMGARQFQGPHSSAASAANYYHEKFSRVVGVDSFAQIRQAFDRGAIISEEPAAPGYGAMFARNKKVAQRINAVVAYTFGPGDEPADGGTLNTWKQIESTYKVHVPLGGLILAPAQKDNQNELITASPVRRRFSFTSRG